MFNENNILIRILTKIFDLILLNLLFVLFSLPVITAGASASALHSLTLRMAAGEEGYIARGFWDAFRSRFALSTKVWLLLLIIGVALAADFRIVLSHQEVFHTIGLCILLIIGFFYYVLLTFVFPLIAVSGNESVRNIIKRALTLPLSKVLFSVPLLLFNAFCIALSFYNYFTIMAGSVIWLLFGCSTLAYIDAFLLRPILGLRKEQES